jgi:pimeloyl-ACP methyl ester carboxylesterase
VPRTRSNGIEICFETSGPLEAPALILVSGFRSQLISWDERFIDLLVDAGFRVVRFDNRDVGLTSKTPGDPPTFSRRDDGTLELTGSPPYTLADMASDAIAVLDELGIDRAHVAGASMGGMIAQHVAFGHPERVLSLTSIMSSTGDRSVGRPTPEALATFLTPSPPDRQGYIDNAAATWKVLSGPHYDEARVRARAGRVYDRCFYPRGAAFQLSAVVSDGDRTERLARVRCPTLVIHGRVDPLITLSGGEATARAIPGAELLVLDEMGHDFPAPVLPDIAAAIAELASRVTA